MQTYGFRTVLYADPGIPTEVDLVDPFWTVENVNIDKTNSKITADLTVTDKYIDISNSERLKASDITVTVDGETAESITKSVSDGTTLTETRDGETVQYGVKYTLTLTNFEEETFQSGKSYMEWAGEVGINIKSGIFVDKNGNSSSAKIASLGTVDFVKPKIKYTYSESDINKTNKTVKVVFSVTDKYFKESTLTADDLTILVDGENPGNKITKSLTSADITATVNGTSKTVGKTYTLTLSNLEQTSIASGKNYLDYSGIITVAIPAGKITDTSNNSNIAKTLTIGINETGETNSGIIKTGLVRYYDAKNNTGNGYSSSATTWKDLSGNADATLNGGTWSSDGYLTLDGTDDWVNAERVGLVNEVTIEVTVTPITIGTSTQCIVGNWNGGGGGIYISGKGYFTVQFYINGAWKTCVSTVAPVVGETYNVATTYDGSTIKVYINGELNASLDASGTIGAPANQTVMAIGCNSWGSTSVDGNFTNCNIHTVRIYNKVLTQEQILNNISATELPSYIPEGYTHVEGTLDTGYVIEDSNGNQFVWVEVPQTTEVYPTAGLSITSFTDAELTKIENDLHTYTSVYREDGYTDTWSSEAATGLTETEYNTQKETMLKSIYTYGGFYVGRYEAGSMTARTSEEDALTTPVIKQNMYPYTFVTNAQAQELSESFSSTGYIGSLMYGVQWDLILKHLENNGATQAELKDDSKNWGNYCNNLYTITNTNSMYSTDWGVTWTNGAYGEKTSSSLEIMLSTGASDTFSKMGIYDFAGNQIEWTLETYPSSSSPCTLRGGDWYDYGNEAANYHFKTITTKNDEPVLGFRTALYKNPDVSPDSNYSTSGKIVDVVDPTWTIENINIDSTNKKVTADIIGSDKYLDVANSGITANDITLTIDGETASSVTKTLSSATALMEDRDEDGTSETQYGLKYTLTLSNFEQSAFQSGKSYIEWSGATSITIPAGKLVDESGNTSSAKTTSLGQVDFIKPKIKYTYSEADIDQTNKTVKVVFTVTDKYFSTSTLTANDLTILVDGENPGSAITKTLTSTDITATVNGTSKTVGKTYTLTLSNLEQTSIASGKNYLDYSGIITVAIPAGKITDTSSNSNDAKTLTVGINETGEGEPSYIPTGYTHVEGISLGTGYVIEDSNGNQFVWVEVPQTTEVYPTAGLDITEFTDAELTKIENDLHTYTSVYRNGTSHTDTWLSENATGLTETEYNTQKEKMLKSIYIYGGFYVGRYEAGTETARTSSSSTAALTTPVIKQNMYPYNYVTRAQAQYLSESFSSTGYIGSLMYGVQWDLIMKHLENYSVTQAELNEDSTSWGNYYNNLYTITNTSAKYSIDYGDTWTDGAYGEKVEDTEIILSTGASDTFSKMGIYDLAGNVAEITLECGNRTTIASVERGWDYFEEHDYPVAERSADGAAVTNSYLGFRVSLYKDSDISIENNDSESGTVADVVDPIWTIENINVDSTNKKVTADIIGTDKYLDVENSGITADDITLTIDGETVTSVTKTLTSATALTEDRDGDGTAETQYGIKYTLTLSKFEESAFQSGKEYMEWSGATSITIPAGKLVDESGNTSSAKTTSLGQVDFIKPKIKYTYSEADIDQTNKTVKVVFTVTDKYFSTSTLTANDLTILVDGENPGSAITKTLTSTDITATVNGTSKTVGKTYTLTLSNLEQTSIASGKNYLDYSGIITIAIPAGKITDTSSNSNDAKTLTVGYDYAGVETKYTGLYIPTGYSSLAGVDGGIKRTSDNSEFVWVRVPRTTSVYPTAGTDITTFSDEEFAKIENDLHTYTSDIREDGYVDNIDNYGFDNEWLEDAIGLTREEYYTQKKKMLKSIYQYQGFYVGRYEAGTTTARKSSSASLTTPVVKQNMYPYNFVTVKQAQELSERFSSTGYISSLMYGVQWDLMLKYIGGYGTDSSSYGNYKNNLYTITNTSSSYSTTGGSSWTSGAYGSKTQSAAVLLSTGANISFNRYGIYDIAGNVAEYTLELITSGVYPVVLRGGHFAVDGSSYPAKSRIAIKFRYE